MTSNAPVTLEEIAILLNQLYVNLNNLDRVYYDLFINPTPMDVSLQRYDENGNLKEYVFPNRAKDLQFVRTGQGNPNEVILAPAGTLYLDIDTLSLYYKSSGSDAFGWVIIRTFLNMQAGRDYVTPTGDGSRIQNLNANNVTGGILKVSQGGTGVNTITGLVKGNGTAPFTPAIDGVDYISKYTFSNLMVGVTLYYASSTPPEGWLECDGSEISRTTYADLFKVIGTVFGSGDDETTFNLPDDRGLFKRSWDRGGTIDPDRLFGSTQLYPIGDSGEPQYTKGVAFGSGYTAPSNGWIYLGGIQDGHSYAHINGVFFEVSYDSGDGQSRGNMFMPVSKGDKIDGMLRIREARFYPQAQVGLTNRAYLSIIKY